MYSTNKKFVFIFFTLNSGGAEVSSINLINHLITKYKLSIEIIVFEKSNLLLEYLDNRVKVINCDFILSKVKIFRFFQAYFLFSLEIIKKYFFTKNTIFVATHEKIPEINLYHFLIVNRIYTRTNISILFIHSFDQFNPSRRNKIINYFKFILLKKRVSSFYKIFAISHDINRKLKKLKISSFVIYNSIDLKIINNEKSNNYIPSISNYFVLIGNISKIKNHIDAIKSFMYIQDLNIRLFIIGRVVDQKYFNECVKLITELKLENRIFFIGEKIPYSYLKNSLGLINVGKHETFSYAVHEAFALRKLVISYRIDN
jgi:glycosyltransferase involved in cell wall biosynthesis